MRCFKKLFKKKDVNISISIPEEEALKPDSVREDGIYPAEFKHGSFIFEEIVKGAKTGNFHPAYINSEYAHQELRSQIADSIYSKECGSVNGGMMTSKIIVIYLGGEVSGFCWSTSPLENTFEIYMLSVRKGSRKAGLGKLLLLDTLASYPKGSKAIARIYKDAFKTDRNKSMQKMLIKEGFSRSVKQHIRTTQFNKKIS